MISVVMPSITDNKKLLFDNIEQTINNTWIEHEIIVITPFTIEKQFPNVKFIKEKSSTGSCAAVNAGASLAQGEYIAFISDNVFLHEFWYNIFNFINQHTAPIGSLICGKFCGLHVPHFPVVRRDFLRGNILNGYIFDPAYHHQYLDNDLALRLSQYGISIPVYNKNIVSLVGDDNTDGNKTNIKKKYFRLDGMMFRKRWESNICARDSAALFQLHDGINTDEELAKIALQRLASSPYRNARGIKPIV